MSVELQGLILREKTNLRNEIVEFWTGVDPDCRPFESPTGPEEKQWMIRTFLVGLAYVNLREILKEYPHFAVLTNDVSWEEWSKLDPLFRGFLSPDLYTRHRHKSVHAGLWKAGTFAKGEDVQNTLFFPEDCNVSDFVEYYLGSALDFQYWFLFRDSPVNEAEVANVIESASDEGSLVEGLASTFSLITYGSEDLAYAFVTKDTRLKTVLESLKSGFRTLLLERITDIPDKTS